MRHNSRSVLTTLLASSLALVLAACSGSDGANGTNGANGTAGTNGINGSPGNPGRSTSSTGLVVTVTSITQPAGQPVTVNFKLTDDFGYPVDLKGMYSVNTVFAPRFALATIMTNGTGQTLPYEVLTQTGSATKPTATPPVAGDVVFSPGTMSPTWPGAPAATDAARKGLLIEIGTGAGTYQYTFPTGDSWTTTSGSNTTLNVVKAVNFDVATVTHTLWIQAARQIDTVDTTNTRTFKAVDKEYNFRPDGGAAAKREVVLTANCSKCHAGFRPETTVGSAFHGGGRVEGTYCNICHNLDRVSNPSADSAVFVHRIHRSEELQTITAGNVTQGSQVNPAVSGGFSTCSVSTPCACTVALPCTNKFHNIDATYPVDIRHCDQCHAGAAQGAQSSSRPTTAACASCHDYVAFTTAASTGLPACTLPNAHDAATGLPVPCAHTGGLDLTDGSCAGCHSPSAIDGYHLAIANPAKDASVIGGANANTNAAFMAAANELPAGISVFSYVVNSVTAVADAGNVLRPTISFKLIKDGAAYNFGNYIAGTKVNLINDDFRGAPSAYFVWSLPQDGVSPADFNFSASCYLLSAWKLTAVPKVSGVATSGFQGATTCTAAAPCACSAGTPCTTTSDCTLSAPDASNNYTVTMTGVALTPSAKMFTGGLGYTYSLSGTPPLTQVASGGAALAKYPYVAPNSSGVVNGVNVTVPASAAIGYGGIIAPAPDAWKPGTGYTARRVIVDNAKCNNCHVQLGANPSFHAGQRNDGPSCAFCHRPNQTSSAWSANGKDFIHALHGGRVRTVSFSWHATAPGQDFSDVGFPAALDTCQACHVPGGYDFSGSDALAALPSMLPSTVGQGRYNSNPATNPTGYFSISPYVQSDNTVDYGYGYATAPVTYTLPDGISGTQGATVCTPTAPCTCTAANRCSITVNGPVTVQGVLVNFTQRVDTTTTAVTTCSAGTPCTCQTNPSAGTTTACTAVLATCSPGAPCDAQPSTLVKSPIVSACSACHDSRADIAHMEGNGGTFYGLRTEAVGPSANVEQCLICHGTGTIAPIGLVHK